jgi:hypothetical protein
MDPLFYVWLLEVSFSSYLFLNQYEWPLYTVQLFGDLRAVPLSSQMKKKMKVAQEGFRVREEDFGE